MLASLCGDDTPGCGAACVVNFLDKGVFDNCAGDFGRVLSAMEDHVEDASRKTGFLHDGANSPEATGRELGAFEDTGVAGCESVGYGTKAEDIGSVPGEFSILQSRLSRIFPVRGEERYSPWGYAEYNAVRFFVDYGAPAFLTTYGYITSCADNPPSNISQLFDTRWYVEIC